MANGSGRLERIERILEHVAESMQEMAARQHYLDEAFERHDTAMKAIQEAIAVDAENIRALARIAELHYRRIADREGGESL